jgi:Asp-tRNA(Asn)/Glu-tRNA(Gln) amidotransferase A subunit family amidase
LADPDAYGPDLQIRLREALEVTAEDYATALEWRSRLRSGLVKCLESFDAIVTPTTAAVTKVIGEEQIQLTTGPAHYRGPLSHFSAPVNNAGLPALSLPVADTGTPPLSLQLVGRPWSEEQLLGIGKAFENSGIC